MSSSRPVTSAERQLGQFIPLHYHWTMLQDEERVTAFRDAITHFVRPGMHVVELGGGTGILSSFAARCGASVECVERNPELADTARRLLALNGLDRQVQVIQADARDFVPSRPADAVICEMLHVGLVRERQTEVIQAFKDNHQRRFGDRLPRFFPEASILMVQLVQQDHDYHGYRAPVPVFQAPGASQPRTIGLSDPVVYSQFCYDESIPQSFDWTDTVSIVQSGELNAVRFLTMNLIGIVPEQGSAMTWRNQFLVTPLPSNSRVQAGEQRTLSLKYDAGAELSALSESLKLSVPHQVPQRRVA